MGKRYLISSKVIIDYTACLLPDKGSDYVENLFDNNYLISVVKKIEVLGFNDIPSKLLVMEEFVNTATFFSLDETVTNKTIQLHREYKKLKLPDAIIAATALVHNLSIISRNTKDFTIIDGLKVIEPYMI